MNSAAELRRQAHALAANTHAETLATLNLQAIQEARAILEQIRNTLDETANQISTLCDGLAKRSNQAALAVPHITADPAFLPDGAPWAIQRAILSTCTATFGVDVSDFIDTLRSFVFETDSDFQDSIGKICESQRAAGDAYALTVDIINNTPAADLPGLLDELKGGEK